MCSCTKRRAKKYLVSQAVLDRVVDEIVLAASCPHLFTTDFRLNTIVFPITRHL